MRIGLCCLTAVALCGVGCKDDGAAQAGGQFAEVSAFLGAKCVRCHGAMGKPKAGIDLQTYAAVMKGGSEGPIVIAGNPGDSALIQALRGQSGKKKMPFSGTPLPEDDIKKVEDWIKAGAKE